MTRYFRFASVALAVACSLGLTAPLAHAATASVVINEFSSDSSSDWVELYNASTSPIDLTGWKLKDFTGNPHTFSGTIAAGGFATTSFSNYLNVGGDEMYLIDTTGATSSAVAYGGPNGTFATTTVDYEYAPTPASGQSAYRTTDGGATWAVGTPTEGVSNNTPCTTGVPATGLLVDVTQKVANDPDSGNGVSYWAIDNFTRHIQVWQEGSSYCAETNDSGTFTTPGGTAQVGIVWPKSPQSGAALPESVVGTMTGSMKGEITGGSFSDRNSWGTSGTTTPDTYDCAGAACSATSQWIASYFGSGANFSYGDNWGWTYASSANGTWVNSPAANAGTVPIGDIVHVTPTTVYVDPSTGNDSNYGDAAHPVATVDAAMTAVASGGTVELVATTTPYGNITITRPLTLTSADTNNKAQIDGQITVQSDSVTISNLDITNPTAGYGIVAQDYSNLTITGNAIHDIGSALTSGSAQAVYVKAYNTPVSSIAIENNTITNVGTTTLAYGTSGSAKGIFIGDSNGTAAFDGVTISGNIITGVYADGVDAWHAGGAGAYGIEVNHTTGSVATNNLAISGNTISTINGLWAHAIGLEGNTPNAVVSNNTITSLTNHGSDTAALRLEDNAGGTTVSGSGNTLDGTPLSVGRDAVLVDTAAPTISGTTYPEVLVGGAYHYLGVNAFPTIAAGIAAANAGATLTVDAGTYAESVALTKALTLNATGATLTGTSTVPSYILEIAGANGVTVNGLTVDGGASNAFTAGILVSNAGTSASPVTLENLTVKNIWGGSANGIDITAATVGGSYVLAHNDTVSSFEKRGIRFTRSSGKVYSNDISGEPVDGTARVQNLVNLWGGSTVEVYDNQLHGGYSPVPGTWDSPAVFVSSYDGSTNANASTANIHDNTIYSVDTGVTVGSYYAPGDGSTATIANNAFHDVHTAVNFEQGTAHATIHDNSFGTNVVYGVNADDGHGGPATLPAPDATKNWWGAASGPTASSSPSGSGALAFSGASYEPWYADAGMTTLKWETHASGSEASTTVASDTTLTGTSTDAGTVSVTATIPSGTVVTGASGWDGTIAAPAASTTALSLAGSTVTTTAAVVVGSSAYDLTFDQPVKLIFAGQAGKRVGFYNAAGTFAEITDTCDSATNPTLADGAACKIDSAPDLIVWTKHFSTYVTYTSAPNAPTISPNGSVFHGTQDVTMDDTASGAFVRYTTDGTDPTCGSGNGYANGQVLTFSSGTTLKALRCETGGTVYSSIASAVFSPAGGSGGSSGGSVSTPVTIVTTPTPVVTAPVANQEPQGEVLGAAAYNFTKNLSVGMQGTDVTELQNVLIAEGFLKIAAPTGYFGSLTKAAAAAYQKAHSIMPTSGYVGVLTRAELNNGIIATTPETPAPAQTNLTSAQVDSILTVLESFNVDAVTLAKVKAALGR